MNGEKHFNWCGDPFFNMLYMYLFYELKKRLDKEEKTVFVFM